MPTTELPIKTSRHKPTAKTGKGVVSARYQPKGISRVNVKASDKITQGGINRNVAPHGYAADDKELENIELFGYDCPRSHFIYGSPDLTPNAIATIWGLIPETVELWAKNDKWHDLKAAQLAKIPPSQGGTLVTEKALSLRDEQTEREIKDYDELLGLAMDRARAVSEEMNTAIGPQELKKTDASFAKVAATVLSIHERRRVAVGLPTKDTGQYAGANITVNQVKEIVIESPGQSERERYRSESLKALEAGEESNCADVVEGVVE
jgi:hypothetical protein